MPDQFRRHPRCGGRGEEIRSFFVTLLTDPVEVNDDGLMIIVFVVSEIPAAEHHLELRGDDGNVYRRLILVTETQVSDGERSRRTQWVCETLLSPRKWSPSDERRLLPNSLPRMRPPRLRRTLDPAARASTLARVPPHTLHKCAAQSADNDERHRGEHLSSSAVPPVRRSSKTRTGGHPVTREKHSATTIAITSGGELYRTGGRDVSASGPQHRSLTREFQDCQQASRQETEQSSATHRSNPSTEIAGAAGTIAAP